MPRVVIMPRWSGTERSDWYPWLIEGLPEATVEIARLLPTPDAPVIDDCVAELNRVAGTDPDVLADTLLVGHSVGAQAQLRYLASLPEGAEVMGLICVAGWFWVDEPWDTLRPWQDEAIDDERVRGAAGSIRVLLSDDDPFTSAYLKNAEAWTNRLGADATILPGRKHFNAAEEPAVLEAVEKALQPVAPPDVG